MAIDVELMSDPAVALDSAVAFLASDPVRHNLILTLLQGRVASPREGRYLVASVGARVAGVVFQSPLSFIATITPIGQRDRRDMRRTPGRPSGRSSGVSGEAGSAASFAGQWAERTKSAAVPDQGQRIYEAGPISSPPAVPGRFRRADGNDRALLVEWLRGFHEDIRKPDGDPEVTVSRRVAAGEFWMWENNGPVSMAALAAPVAGVARVQAVYTPPSLRNHGYASACVAQLSAQTIATGTRCILYTDLGNPISNSVYRRLGYRAVAEVLRYNFT